MSVAASVIINRARDVLIDAGATRWTDQELLRWLSDGQRAVVMAVPAACARRQTLTLEPGTLQTLPAGTYMLISVERNNGAADGTQPGRAVRLVPREMLDNFNPDWHSATAQAVVQSYVYDPATTPLNFYVSPPNDGTGHADVVISQLPTEITATAQNISIDDIYQTPLVDYVLYRAFLKDSDYATVQTVYQAKSLAQGYLDAFVAAVGTNPQAKAAGAGQ
jgi:hypothetical protein